MIRHQLTLKSIYIAGCLLASLAGIFMFYTYSANAISNRYFDSANDASGDVTIAGVVGKTPYVTEASLYVKAYFTTRTGNTITIADYAFCSADTKYDDNGNSGSNNSNVTRYRLKIPGKDDVDKFGKKNNDCRRDLVINANFPAGSKPDPRTGYYEATLDVDHVGGSNVQNMFRIVTSGVAVTHASRPTTKGSEVTIEQSDAEPKNINYAMRFGADCSVTSRQRAVISLFDLDNNGGNGAQLNGKVTISLDANGSTRKFKVSNNDNPNQVSLNGSVNSAKPDGDGKRIYLHFEVNPGEKFVLRMKNVYHNNTVQFNLPFDGIYYQRDCQKWNMEAKSYVKLCDKASWGAAGRTLKVSRGAKVCFRHEAQNTSGGGAATTKGQRQRTWDANKFVVAYNTTGLGVQNINNLVFKGTYATNTVANFTIPTNATKAYNGAKYCMRYVVTPKTKDGANGTSGTETSAQACAEVSASTLPFELTPGISITPNTYSYYPNIGINGSISANPEANVSGNHPWEIYAVRYDGTPSPLDIRGDTGAANACDRPTEDGRIGGCELIYSGNFPANRTASFPYTSGGPDAVGTNVCFFARIQHPDESMDGSWRYSQMSCARSGVKPKIQVRGGDAKATGVIETSVVDIQTRRFGSWGEYGVLSLGSNSAMGSASTLGLPSAYAGSAQSNWSNLTFRNNGAYGDFGVLTPHVPVSRNAAAVHNGDLEIDDMSDLLAAGSRRTLVVNGTLTISSDLAYPNALSSIKNIPRIVLVANNIVITGAVQRIDTWLVANNLSTCDDVSGFQALTSAGLLDSGKCSEPLRFNGPVIADKLYLYRTYDTVDGQPAETFNLRADNFLSSYAGGISSDPVATTSVVKEAPPRF